MKLEEIGKVSFHNTAESQVLIIIFFAVVGVNNIFCNILKETKNWRIKNELCQSHIAYIQMQVVHYKIKEHLTLENYIVLGLIWYANLGPIIRIQHLCSQTEGQRMQVTTAGI